MQLNIPCHFKMRDDGPSCVNGIIIGFAKRQDSYIWEWEKNNPRFNITVTVDALIILRDMAIGQIHQVPLHRITVNSLKVKELWGSNLLVEDASYES
jgi:hypothetical protein